MKTKNLLLCKRLHQITLFATVMLFICFSLESNAVTPDSQERYPSSAGQIGVSGGANWYVTDNNLAADDEDYCSNFLSLYPTEYLLTHKLYAWNFDFSIPGGSVITGIEVTVGRYCSFGRISDVEMVLMYDNQPIGDDKAVTDIMWPVAAVGDPINEITYGGMDDLWGTTWTPSKINYNFGVRLQAKYNKNEVPDINDYDEPIIDYIKIKVYYLSLDPTYCQGSAVEVLLPTTTNSVNPENALGEPDGSFAILPGNYGAFALDLTGEVESRPAGGKIKVRCRFNSPDFQDKYMAIYLATTYTSNTGNWDWDNPAIIFFKSSEMMDYEVTFDSNHLNTRYILFNNNPFAGVSVDIDAVTYSCGICDPPVITLGSDNPVCYGNFEAPIHYTSITNCNEESRLIIDWEDESIPDMNESLLITSDWPDETGHIYAYLPENHAPGTYIGNLSLQTGDCTSAINPFSVTVVSPPATPVVTNSGPVCTGSTFTLSVTDGVESYRWYGFNGETYDFLSDFESTINIVTNESWMAGDYTYQVYKISNGCWSEAGSTTVTVSKKPYAGAFEYETLTLCEGTVNSVYFSIVPDPGGEWLSNDPTIAIVNEDGEVTGISEGTAIVSYKVTGSGGCSELFDEATIVVTVTQFNAQIIGNNSPLCGSGTAEFYLTGTPGSEVQYVVNNSGYGASGNTFDEDGNLTIYVSDVTTVQTLQLLALTSGESCYKQISGESTVVVFEMPVVQVLPLSANINEGGSVTLSASGANNYIWEPETGLNATTESEVIASPVENTIYTVTGYIGTCSNTASAEITVQETCKNSPDQYEPNNTMAAASYNLKLDNQIAANLINTKDQDWYLFFSESAGIYTISTSVTKGISVEIYNSSGRKLRSTERSKPNTYSLVGESTYYIKVSGSGFKGYLCYTLKMVFDSPAADLVVELLDETKSAEIESFDGFCKVWPNPTSNEFKLYNGNDNSLQLRITDLTGRTIEIIDKVASGETVVFGSNYKSGLYLVETLDQELRQVFKVAKK